MVCRAYPTSLVKRIGVFTTKSTKRRKNTNYFKYREHREARREENINGDGIICERRYFYKR